MFHEHELKQWNVLPDEHNKHWNKQPQTGSPVKGYNVSVVYLDEDNPGSRLMDLEEPIGGVMIAVPPDQTEKAVQHVIKANIRRVRIQQGSESKSAIQLCDENGITAIHGECVLMFAEPVKSFHAFHRWIWKLLGKLPD